MALSDQLPNLADNVPDTNGPVNHRRERRQVELFRARHDCNRGNARNQSGNRRMIGKTGGRFENYCRWEFASCECVSDIIRRFHSQGPNACFNEFRAYGSAQSPIARDYEDDWHLCAAV
jgi:hypothetical protein